MSFPSTDNETPTKSLPSRYTWTVPTLIVSMDCAGRRDDKRNTAATMRDGFMEDSLFGRWFVRLSNALSDVICLKRRTSFSRVLSMLLTRHERQSNLTTGVCVVLGGSIDTR